jgi:hypothetical protein
MSIYTNDINCNWDDPLGGIITNSNATTKIVADHLIQGKMLTAQHIIGMAETLHFDNEESFRQHVKQILAQKLAEKIIEEKLAEFTIEKVYSTQSTVVRGRCFLTPDSNVRILRKDKRYE